MPSNLLVILDTHHTGKPSKLDDRGASSGAYVEAELVPLYLLSAAKVLRAGGAKVIPMADGDYDSRHGRANKYAADFNRQTGGLTVYIAGHLNAGGGDYGLFCYDHRSRATRGQALAGYIAARVKTKLGLKRVVVDACSPSKWENAFSVIDLLEDPIGICSEPLFIDCPAHQPHLNPQGMEKTGAGIGEGILEWITAYR